MKKYLISTVVFLVVLVVAWPIFGQQEGRRPGGDRQGRGGPQNVSPEERAKMRERFQNMSEEEREKFRTEMRERFSSGRGRSGRGGFAPEEQLKAIKAIEEQCAKLKAGVESMSSGGRPSFQDLSEEERTKLRESFTKARQEREKAIQAILAQVARLQGQRPPAAEGGRFILINASELKPIQDLAVKEKAEKTAASLERLLRGGGPRGFGGPGARPPGGPGGAPGGQRRPRGPQQDQEGSRRGPGGTNP